MSVTRSFGKIGTFLFAATIAAVASQSARAESGLFWYDTAVVYPAHQMSHTAHWKRVHRVREAGVSANRVAYSSQAPIEVASAAPRNDCFWCNARVTGLAF